MKYSNLFMKQVFEDMASCPLPAFEVPVSLSLLRNMRSAVTNNNLIPTHLVLGAHTLEKLLYDSTVSSVFELSDPEDVKVGYAGFAVGLDFLTESFVAAGERCLPNNFLGILSLESTYARTWGTEAPITVSQFCAGTLVSR